MRWLMLLIVLAGCAAPVVDEPTIVQPGSPAREGTMPTGQGARDYIESYVMNHPFRADQAGYESFMAAARDDLGALLEAAGHEVVRHEYDGGMNILGIQRGTTVPNQWVVLSAHYDIAGTRAGGVGTTVYGAWDDGAGTALLIELAHKYADWEFPFTIVYAFFDGEEKGLLGSSSFVDDHFGSGSQHLLANINTDPPGLNWPCGDETGLFPVKVIHNMEKVRDGLPAYVWLHDAVSYGLNASGIPVEFIDGSPGIPIATAGGTGIRGTSDHASFDAVDIGNVFLGGTPTTEAASRDNAALSYPLHTPLDTLEAMEARCTQGSLAGGLDTHAKLFSHTLAEMARTMDRYGPTLVQG